MAPTPSPTMTVSHGVVVSAPIQSSAVTTASHATALIAFEADELAGDRDARHARRWRADRDRRSELDACRVESLRRPRRDHALELVARDDRMDLGGAGRDHDLAAWTWSISVGVRPRSSGPA